MAFTWNAPRGLLYTTLENDPPLLLQICAIPDSLTPFDTKSHKFAVLPC